MNPAYGYPAVYAPPTAPAAPPNVIKVPIKLEAVIEGFMSGHYRFNPSAYTLELTGVMGRDAFQSIIDQLNACTKAWAPRIGQMKWALLCPILGLCAISNMASQYARFRRELEATCQSIIKASPQQINLRVVEIVKGYRKSRCQELFVELEVLAWQ